MAIYTRILLAIDLTPQSLAVGERAQALAAALDATLDIIHVVKPIIPVAPLPPEPVAVDIIMSPTDMIDAAHRHIEPLARNLRVSPAHCHVIQGNIKAEIIRFAIDRAIDLIVIGSRERHGLTFLIKPTEDVVVHRAPCDVLAVRLIEGTSSP